MELKNYKRIVILIKIILEKAVKVVWGRDTRHPKDTIISPITRQTNKPNGILFEIIRDEFIKEAKTRGGEYRMGNQEFNIICNAEDEGQSTKTVAKIWNSGRIKRTKKV